MTLKGRSSVWVSMNGGRDHRHSQTASSSGPLARISRALQPLEIEGGVGGGCELGRLDGYFAVFDLQLIELYREQQAEMRNRLAPSGSGIKISRSSDAPGI